MRIVAGVDIDRDYTADEVVEMHRSGRLRDISLHGYVAQADWEGKCRFVHWTKANAISPGENELRVSVADATPLREGLPPIRKRTPQQRVDSLTGRLAEQAKLGGLPLPEYVMSEVLRRRWVAGDPVTAEDVRAVAAHSLAQAEARFEEAERHRVTRTTGNPMA